VEDQSLNREPQDMLRVVPGVTGKNIKSLVVEMGSLREVANASVEELEPAVGKEAGRQIYRFFNKSVLE
jgi:DNA excision repair protein ERCC-4